MKIKSKLKIILSSLMVFALGFSMLFPNISKAAPKNDAIDITKGEERVFIPKIDNKTKVTSNFHRISFDNDKLVYHVLADNDFRPEMKGKWYIRYQQVGTIGGKHVDLVVRLKDWAALDINANWWRSNHINENSLGDLRNKSNDEIKNHFNSSDYNSKSSDFDSWVYGSKYVDSTLSLFIRKAYDKPLRILKVADPKTFKDGNATSTISINSSLSIPYIEIEQYLVYSNASSSDEDNRLDTSKYNLKLSMNINDIDWGQQISFDTNNMEVNDVQFKKNNDFLSTSEYKNYYNIRSKAEGDDNTDRSAAVMTFKPKEGNKNLKLRYIYSNLPPDYYNIYHILTDKEKNKNTNTKEWASQPTNMIEEYTKKHNGSYWKKKNQFTPTKTVESLFHDFSGNRVGGNNMYYFGTDLTSMLSNLYASKMTKSVTDRDENHALKNTLHDVNEKFTYNIKGYIPSLKNNNENLSKHIFTDKLDSRLEYVEGSLDVTALDYDYTKFGKIEYDKKTNTLKWTANSDFLSKTYLRGINIEYSFSVKIKDGEKENFNYKKDIVNIANQVSHDYQSESNKTVTKVKELRKIKIIKVDDKGKKLSGVEFSIYDSNKKYIDKTTTNENGELIFKNLTGTKYYIRETKTIDGYRLNNKYYPIDFLGEYKDKNIAEIKITNTPTDHVTKPGEPTPTGTYGVMAFVGGAIILGGIAFYLNKRNNKKDEE